MAYRRSPSALLVGAVLAACAPAHVGDAPPAASPPGTAAVATGAPAPSSTTPTPAPSNASARPGPSALALAGEAPAAGARDALDTASERLRAEGIAAMDQCRFDEARRAFERVLEHHPGNAATLALRDTATRLLDWSQRKASIDLTNLQPRPLPSPPFAYTLRRPAPGPTGAAPRLVKRSDAKNAITDHVEWFQRNGLRSPALEVPNKFMNRRGELPPGVPTTLGNAMLIRCLDHGDHMVLVFGADFSDGRFVAVVDRNRQLVAFFDFGAWQIPPVVKPGDGAFVSEGVNWAQMVDGVLYVQNGHRTYAASSGGKNAYLTALDARTGELLWRSDPLVANAGNFVVRGGHLIAGYGFTAEPDFLFVLDRATGKVVSRLPVASGPESLIEKDGSLFVRTYDRDYVFGIE